jgi:hypothetical protein
MSQSAETPGDVAQWRNIPASREATDSAIESRIIRYQWLSQKHPGAFARKALLRLSESSNSNAGRDLPNHYS